MSSSFDQQSVSHNTFDAPTWARISVSNERWVEVDNALRGIARRRAALDADEARWLREAQALKIWKPLGMTNAQDYMERILGYAPKSARDRMPVAEALGELPVLEQALSQGELSFSAVRELSRIATRETDAAWTHAAKGKNLRDIETLVAGCRAGDLPDDPPDADVRTHVVRFELSPETFAAMRQARSILDTEHRTNLTDDEFITVLANLVLEGAADFATTDEDDQVEGCDDDHPRASPHFAVTCEGRPSASATKLAAAYEGTEADSAASERAGYPLDVRAKDMTDRDSRPLQNRTPRMTRAKYQVAVTLCPRCRQGWQLGAGAMIAIGPAAVARAECDAQHIGSLDATAPQRAHQDISPAVARFVWRRDQGRCQTPGCRSARGLEIHHLVSREDDGGHDASNLRLLCSSCHHALHDGRLAITVDGKRVDVRTAALAIEHPAPRAAIETAGIRTQAKDALVGLGWKPAIAATAADAALAALGSDVARPDRLPAGSDLVRTPVVTGRPPDR